jgi:hypothetical protein
MSAGRIYTICAVALYPVWGLVSSSLLLNSGFLHSRVLRSAAGIALGGLLPVALHCFEVLVGKAQFEWKTVLISITLGGVFAIFLGTLLQGFLLLCGIHSVFGLRIDTWYWEFPDWMFQGGD